MKKEFKKSILAITASGLLVLTLSACGEPSGVSTGESKPAASQNETPEQKNDIKKSAINKDFIVNGLKIKIGEIQVQKDKVLVGITVKNDGKDKLTFYPDQGTVVIGSTQLNNDMFSNEGETGGDVQTGVEKSGVIHFAVPEGKDLDPKTVTSVQLHFGDVFNDKTFEAKPFDQTIELK